MSVVRDQYTLSVRAERRRRKFPPRNLGGRKNPEEKLLGEKIPTTYEQFRSQTDNWKDRSIYLGRKKARDEPIQEGRRTTSITSRVTAERNKLVMALQHK